MTAVIDTIFGKESSLINLIRAEPQNRDQIQIQKEKIQNSTEFQKQNTFEIIVKQVYCPYDLLFNITSTAYITLLRIHLLKENGSLIKIPQQESKTYLIRKFLKYDNLYSPRIDPATGAIFFHIDYFDLKPQGQSLDEKVFRQIYNNLNLEKLFQSIQKFVALYQSGKQNNWFGGDIEDKKKYQQLTKIVCSANDSNLMEVLSQLQSIRNPAQPDNPQNQETKKLLSDLEQFILSEKVRNQPASKRPVSRQIKDIELSIGSLETLTKRKSGKSNYETLYVSHQSSKQLKEKLTEMVSKKMVRTTMRVNENDLGKITLNIEREDDLDYRAKMQFLSLMPKNTEYHFIDKYFKQNENYPIIISLSLKEESAQRFLLTNSMCISMETKMRILLQICSAVHTLWEEKNIILNVSNFRKVFITKNLTVKLRNITNFYKADTYAMLEEKREINMRLLDNWLNLSEIYFKLFFGQSIAYVRPSVANRTSLTSVAGGKSIIMSRKAVGAKLLPEGFQDPIKEMLVGLNYIFLSYIDKASKLFKDSQASRRASAYESFQDCREQSGQDASPVDRLLSSKLSCCWLYKNFEMISGECY